MELITKETLARYSSLSNSEFHRALELEFRNAQKQELLVVYLMREADRRRIWIEMGFSSLMEYCVRSFKISETDFYRKKSILKTIQEIPEIETKILEGKLNTTAVAQAVSFINREARMAKKPISIGERRDVFEMLEGKTYREVQREFATPQRERERAQALEKLSKPEPSMQREYVSTPELEALISRARDVFSNLLPATASHTDLLKKVFEIALASVEQSKRAEKTIRRQTSKERHSQKALRPTDISVFVKDTVSRRDHYSCSHIDKVTGRRCGHKEGLEFEHLTPPSEGGLDTIDNLHLVCRSHRSNVTPRGKNESQMEVTHPL